MLDIRKIQESPEELDKMLTLRHYKGFDSSLLKKDLEIIKQLKGRIDGLRMERNSISKEIGGLMASGNKGEAEDKKSAAKKIGEQIEEMESEHAAAEEKAEATLSVLPNWIDKDVPEGTDEKQNVQLREAGTKPSFDFTPLTHYEIGEKSGILDFAGGVKLSGSRFYSYRGLAARLERALLNFMLDTHTSEFSYEERWVPSLILDEGMYVTGQYPKFKGEFYNLAEDGLSLIPTAEVPLVNLYRDEIIPGENLPIALTAATSCFRREAGAAGKDTRGLIRVHEFRKVELVRLVHPDESRQTHEAMLAHAEEILIRLRLPYRVLLLCSGDMGASAARTYDLEVWMPGLDRYLEISSISNCLDYQARRGRIRFRESGGKGSGGKDSSGKKSKPAFVHTLNGSGLAAGRAMAAIMENYQTESGAFDIPDVLKPYL